MKTKTNPQTTRTNNTRLTKRASSPRAPIYFAALFCSILLSSVASAQLSGTKNIPGDYADLGTAITDLNTQGVGAGGVILNVVAGNPQSAPSGGYSITASGTAGNQIIIQGNANTVTAFSPQTVASTFDAIFKIVGGNFITIQNFNMIENSGNTVVAVATNTMTEFGVLLVHSSATTGCQNNTIQNNTISLNSTYTNSVGIFSTSASSSVNGTQDATSTAGTNSNNKIYGNILTNVAQGILFICPPITAAIFETGNDVGGTSAATGNTITFGNAVASSGPWNRSQSTVQAGIYYRNGAGNSMRFNGVTSSSAAYVGSGGLNGIMISSGAAPTGVTYTSTISDNTVNITSTGIALLTGIDFGHGISTGTIVGSNNNVTVNQTSSAANSAVAIGIKANYASATNTCSSNTVVINPSSSVGALSGATTGMTLAGASTTNTANSNNITINQAGSGTGTITSTTSALSVAGAATTINALNNTILVNQTTSVATGITTGQISGILANAVATTVNVGSAGNPNTITIKQAVTGAGTYGTNAVRYIDVNAASGTINVLNNVLNTTASTIRSTGNLIGVFQDSTVTVLVNVQNNTMNVDRVAATGALVTFQSTSGSPSEVNDNISNNNITFTSLAGTTACTGISSLGGNGFPKTISGNTISISGTHTGASIGITSAFTGTGTFQTNSITISCASTAVTGLTVSGSGGTHTISGNSLNMVSSATAPTAMTGLAITSGTGAHSVTNNTFTAMNFTGILTTSPTVSGIVVAAGTGANIFSNTVTNISVGAATSTGSPIVDGILISGGTSLNVFKNKIYDLAVASTGTTTIISGTRISGGTTVNVSNNLIGQTNTLTGVNNPDSIRGINITSAATSTINVFYNTVFINSSSTGATNFGSTGLFHAASATATVATLNLRNNVIVNTSTQNGTGLTVAFRRSVGTVNTLNNYGNSSNNNDFYAGTPGAANLIYSDTTGTGAAQTISAYRNGIFTAGNISPRDSVSLTENPPFQSTSGASGVFLHITAGATQLESGGAPISGFADDFDGQARNVNFPDIGADEFTGTISDSTPPLISYTALTSGPTGATRTFSNVVVTDPSSVNGTAGTRPRVYYKKSTDANNTFNDNTSATVGWKFVEATGASSPFSFTIDYSLLFGGGGVVATDVIQYFVVAQDLAGTPNVAINSGIFTAQPTSVALTAAAFPILGTINSYTIVPSLSGTLTVGGGGTYATLTSATGLFNDINTKVLTSNLIVNIQGNLTEDGAVALNQWAEDGVGGYTVTIQSDSAVERVISGAVANGMIRLNGADRVTFDGRFSGSGQFLRFRNTNTSNSTFTFLNDATNNTIDSCFVESANTSTTSGTILFSTSTGTLGNSSNTIIRSDIRDLTGSVGVPANGVYSSGTGAAPNATNTISTCKVFNWTNSGVLVSATGAGNGWVVNPSSFYQTAARTTALIPISIQGGSGHSILNNSIGGAAPDRSGTAMATTSTFSGISLAVGIVSPTSVQGNTISNLNITGGSTQTWQGINITAGNVNVGTIAGNVIGGAASAFDTIATNYDSRAIQNTGVGVVNIENNIIGNITYANNSNDELKGIQVTAGTNTIRNNVIRDLTSNAIAGGSFYLSGITLAPATAGNLVEGNQVSNLRQNNATGGLIFNIGIVVAGPTGTTEVRKNKISNINADLASLLYGIYSISGSVTYSNNFVALPASSQNHFIGGIRDDGTGTNNYYFNSVNITGTVTTGATSTYGFFRNGTATVTLRDNIFSNTRTGGTGFHVAMANANAAATGWAATASDYNDLFNAVSANLCQWLGTAAANNRDLPGWRASQGAGTPGSGGDANAISADPLFVNSTNLHLQPSGPARDVGIAFGGIVTDIDGDARPLLAGFDMGADEVPNSAPTIAAAAGVTRQQGSPVSNSTIATVNDVDTGAGSVVVTVTSANPSNGVTISNIVNTSGTVTADVVASCSATNATFTLQASDGSLLATDTLSVTVTANPAPTLTYNNDSVAFNGSTSVNPATGPSDNGSVSTIAVQSTGTYTGTISVDNVTGIVSISNAAPIGSHTITIRATDNCGTTTDATFTLNVTNTAPSIAAAAGVTRQQSSPVSNSTIATVNDTESGAGSVVVTVTSANPSNGVTISNIVNTAGTVTADVVASCSATNATFTLQASDGNLSATDTLSVTVTANAAPTLTYNNDSVAFNGSTSVNPATGPSDNGSVSTIAVQSTGTYTGTISVDNVTGIVSISNAAPIGSHTITIRATDNCGTTTDATFTLNVTNTAPTIAAAAGVTRQQGTAALNSTIAIVNDTESGAGSVVVTVTSANPSNGVTISNIVNTAGTVTADVVASCSATNATFTLQASDGNLSATDTLSVTVTANTAPTLSYNDDSVPLNGSTSVNPATGPSDNGSVSTIAVQSTGTYTGTISVDNVTGIVSISNAAPVGLHTITIRATDNCGTTTDATFTLTVDCVAPSTVYVDDSWAGTTPGADPDGAGPATSFGCDSFATIQDGINGVAAAAPAASGKSPTALSMVAVNPGNYPGDVNINKPIALVGPQAGVNPDDVNWNDVRTNLANEAVIQGAVNLSIPNTITVDGFTINRSASNEGHILIGGGLPGGSDTTTNLTIQNNRIVGTRSTGPTWSGIHTNFLDNFPGPAFTLPGANLTVTHNRIEIGGTSSTNGILINRLVPGTDNNSSLSITGNYIASDPFNGSAVATTQTQVSSGVAQVTGNYLPGGEVAMFRTLGANIANNQMIAPAFDGVWLNGGDDNITVDGNTITNPVEEAILIGDFGFSAPTARPNSNITVSNNTITVDATLLDDTGYAMFDVGGGLTGTNTISGNSLTITGALPSGITDVYGVRVHNRNIGAGSDPQVVGSVSLTGNTFSGGGMLGGNSAGLKLDSNLTSATDVTLGNGNSITGFPFGVDVPRGTAHMSGSIISASGTAVRVNASGSGADPVTMTITNSTLSGNTATNGGAINGVGTGGMAKITVTNSTLSGNSPSGASILLQDASLTVGNSIFNTKSPGTNISALGTSVVTSLGFNLSSDNFGGFLTGTGDQVSTDPMLGPLQNNGGPTKTHAPLVNSPALDQGKDIGPIGPAYTATGVDQRGSARPVNDTAVPNAASGDASDIGAVELALNEIVHANNAASNKTHDAAGDFLVDLPLSGPVGIECRSGGATNAYQVIVTFASSVTFTNADVTSGTGTVDSATGTGTTQATINLSGVTDVQTLVVALFNVNDGPNTSDIGIRARIRVGDVTATDTVNSSDIGIVKSQIGQLVGLTNFRSDVTVNGAINSSDVSLVKSKQP